MTTLLPFALSLLLQSTALLLLGLLALHITRQRGPAVQSLVGHATLSGVALLLLLAPLPGHLRIQPVWRVSMGPSSAEPTPPRPSAPLPKREGKELRTSPGPSFRWEKDKTASQQGTTIGKGAESNQGAARSEGAASSAPTPVMPPLRLPLWGGPLRSKEVGSYLYAAVTLTLLLWLGVCQWHLTRLRRTATLLTSGPAAEMLAELTARPPRVLTHPAVRSPFLAGLFRPAIFLPTTYAADFSPDALRAILAHELAHLQRRDNAWTLASRLLCALLWPQPLLWLLCRQLEQIAEDACDAAVLAQNCPPRAYADCLLTLAECHPLPHRQRALGAGVAPYRSSLGRRVQRILTQGKPTMSPVTTKLRFIIAALTLAAVLGGVCLVSSAPAKPADTTAPVLTPQEQRFHTAYKQDLQNLKQIGLAIVMYEQDHHARTPDANHWMNQITPYLKDPTVLFDPFQPGTKRYGYAFNRLCSNKSLFVFSNPQETVIVYDSTLGKRNASDTGQSPSLRTIKRSSNNSFISILGTSYGFVDGHAKWFTRGIHPSFSLKGGEPTGAALSAPMKIRYFVKLPHSLAKSNIELSKAQFLAGLTAVQGPGVIVTLRDSKQPFPKALPLDMLPPNIIHDSDINQVVNELKAAGAEAIAVNDQRLVATSAVRCVGPLIYVNNVPQAPPYTLKAIGNATEMLSVLKMPGGIATQIQAFDPAMFSVRASNLLELPAFTDGSSPRYATPISAMPTSAITPAPSQTLQQKITQTQFKMDVLSSQESQININIQKMRTPMQQDIAQKMQRQASLPVSYSQLASTPFLASKIAHNPLFAELAAAQADWKTKENTLAPQDPARIAAQKKAQRLQEDVQPILVKLQFLRSVHQYNHQWVEMWKEMAQTEAPAQRILQEIRQQKYQLALQLRTLKTQLQKTQSTLSIH